ncbi:MAG: hypothetical protein HY821_18360 [Acidobacteria bacterium]|nr:hypothetical protein [Acidobacteriota bacterium]
MIELGLARFRPGLLLLNPHADVVMDLAVAEGFAKWKFVTSPRRPPSEDRIAATLQLLLLDDDVSMLYVPPGIGTRKRQPKGRHVDLASLKSLGILNLIEPDKATCERIRGLDGPSEVWRALAPVVRDYEDLILAQLEAVGRPLHWSILRLLVAVRTGNWVLADLVLPSVPADYRDVADLILIEPLSMEVFLALDRTVSDCAFQVEHASQLVSRGSMRIAGAGTDSAGRRPNQQVAGSSVQLWKLLVSELLSADIELPVPGKLSDVPRIRNLPEMQAFRSFFNPFLDAVIAGDAGAAVRLQKEIQSALRALRMLPMARAAVNWVTYAAIGIGVAEAFLGFAGPSIVAGLIPIGLQRLARKWEAQTSWVYISDQKWR